MWTPGQSVQGKILDCRSKHHHSVHEKATASFHAETKDRCNLEPSKVQALLTVVKARSAAIGTATLEIPATMADIAGRTNGRHICGFHGVLSLEHLTDVVTPFSGKHSREAQDDNMFAHMLRASTTQEAQQILVPEAPDCMINGVESGILLFKAILRESKVDASVNPWWSGHSCPI
jgi:hypothetical protein